MNAKRILVLTAIITVLCIACSNKENQNEVTDTTQAESGSTNETEQEGDSKQNNKETEVTKENFRDYSETKKLHFLSNAVTTLEQAVFQLQ